MKALLTLLPLGLVACTGLEPIEPSGNIIAVGDSIFEWNADEAASIPEVVGQVHGKEVYNAAISGSMVLGDDGEAIPAQYVEGDWAWLIVDGGGNDLNELCGCGACDEVMDGIVSADGTGGALPALVGPAAASGVKVAIMGYPELPPGTEFDGCDDELVELSSRQAAIASHSDNIVFVDARDVVGPDDLHLFDEDNIHPSIEGSEVIGQHISDAMAQVE